MLLIIDKLCTEVSHDAGCLLVKRPAGNQRVPTRLLEQVIVYGNPLISAAAIRALSGDQVPTVFMTSRGAQQNAVIASGFAGQLHQRTRQHHVAMAPEQRLIIARWFVEQKRQNYAIALQSLAKNCPRLTRPREKFTTTLNMSHTSITDVDSIASLLGVEGRMASAWFSCLAAHLPKEWKFTGRNRRPPTDPVNAMLSLGYTLLGAEIRQLSIAQGFDPAHGFLHAPYPGRDSFVLDIIELYRSAIDAFVINLVFSQALSAANFTTHETQGCRLAKDHRSLWYTQWAAYRFRWNRVADNDATTPVITEAEWRTIALSHLATIRDLIKEHCNREDIFATTSHEPAES